MEVGSGPSIQSQVEVLKQATQTQEKAVSQIIEDNSKQLQAQEQQVQESKQTTSALTGLGTGLDVTA